MATTITPGIGKLAIRDVLQGLLMAVSGAVFALISSSISKGVFTFDITAIWHAALVASVAYLGKRFFTPAQIIKPAPAEDSK